MAVVMLENIHVPQIPGMHEGSTLEFPSLPWKKARPSGPFIQAPSQCMNVPGGGDWRNEGLPVSNNDCPVLED